MSLKVYLTGFLAVFTAYVVMVTLGAPEPDPAMAKTMDMFKMDLKCAGETIEVPANYNETVNRCVSKGMEEWTALGKKGALPLPRLACVGVCVMQAFGLIDEKGQAVTDEKVLKPYIDRMPEKVRTPGMAGLKECMSKNTKALSMRPGDCSAYGMMLLCIKANAERVCKA